MEYALQGDGHPGHSDITKIKIIHNGDTADIIYNAFNVLLAHNDLRTRSVAFFWTDKGLNDNSTLVVTSSIFRADTYFSDIFLGS